MKITARQLNEVINLDAQMPGRIDESVVAGCKAGLQLMLDHGSFVDIDLPETSALAEYITDAAKIGNKIVNDRCVNPRYPHSARKRK